MASMAKHRKELSEIDFLVQSLLAEAVEDAGLPQAELGKRTGMSQNRVGIILRRETPPASVGEIGSIAQEVGTSASSLIAEAERRLGRGGVGLSPAPVASDEQQDLSDLDVILAASDRNIDAEVEAWQQEP